MDSEEPCERCPEPGLFASNTKIVELLGACSTQWRISPSGKLIGLDYGGVVQAAAIYGITLDAETFSLFQSLERAYIEALTDRGERSSQDRAKS